MRFTNNGTLRSPVHRPPKTARRTTYIGKGLGVAQGNDGIELVRGRVEIAEWRILLARVLEALEHPGGDVAGLGVTNRCETLRQRSDMRSQRIS